MPAPETLGLWALAAVGGVAFLLAALFGLREAIVAGLLGPAARFALGCGAVVAAWAAAEVLRAFHYRVPAAALGGAGAGAAFAVLWAGHARYGLLGNQLAFGLMVAVTAVTLLVAVRRDSAFMATLGLAGGYATPILLSSGENKAVAFFAYLALLDAGLLLGATRRRWALVLAASGLVTAGLYLGWAAAWRAPDQAPVGLAAAALLGTMYLAVAARRDTAPSVALAAGGSGLLLWACGALFVFPADPFAFDPRSGMPLRWDLGAMAWIALAYLAVAAGLLPRLARARGGLPGAVAGSVVVALLLVVFASGWLFAGVPRWDAVAPALVLVPLVAGLAGHAAATPALALMSGGMACIAATLAVTGELPGGAPVPTVAAIAVGLAIVGVGMGWTRGPRAGLVVGLFAATAPLWPLPTAALEAGRAGLLFGAAALVYALHAWPQALRPRAADLAGALAASLAGPALFFVFYPLWVAELGDGWIGALPLLLGASTLLAALTLVRAVRVRADDRELALLAGTTLLAAAVAVPLQLSEAWLTVGWALEVVALAALSRRLPHPGIRVFALALAAAVSVRLLVNPEALAYGGGEGWILLNWTLYTWGVPGVCLLVAARLWPKDGWAPIALRTAAVFVFFALVNLEVAHAFARDAALSFTSERLAESMTRSVSWAAYGLLLIGVGVVGDRRGARLAGLGFALLGASKVFVVDLWSLSGFARVGSFAGIAVTLLLGAIAFQRFVLKERKP